MKNSNKKVSKMTVRDPGSATGWKTVTVREDPTDGMVDSGLTFAFIIGVVIAIIVMLGYPFYLLGRLIDRGLMSAGLDAQTALYVTIGIGFIYLVGNIILSIVYRRTRNSTTKKIVSFIVRIMVVIIPAVFIGVYLFLYYNTHFVEKQSTMPILTWAFVIGITIILLFVYWKLTTKFILPRKRKA